MEQITDYMTLNDDNSLTINVSDWRGEQEIHVTIDDVVEYYLSQARNIMSGCRTLAGFTGDWRPIDNLAQECLDVFKEIDIDTLREKSIKRGLTPKF